MLPALTWLLKQESDDHLKAEQDDSTVAESSLSYLVRRDLNEEHRSQTHRVLQEARLWDVMYTAKAAATSLRVAREKARRARVELAIMKLMEAPQSKRLMEGFRPGKFLDALSPLEAF